MIETVIGSLHIFLSLVLLWVLVFWCWTEYKIDLYRQKLFEVRDELFDYAAGGAISFNDPAYYNLRASMNGIIRFLHRISFAKTILSFVVERYYPTTFFNPQKEWEEALRGVPSSEVREKMEEFRRRMLFLVVDYMISRSILLKGLADFLCAMGPSPWGSQTFARGFCKRSAWP